MTETIEFDWDAENVKHLNAHRVSPQEFEDVILGDPTELEYQVENGEERYRVLGTTRNGRLLIAVWTPRGGQVRAVTAYRAGPSDRKLYREARRRDIRP